MKNKLTTILAMTILVGLNTRAYAAQSSQLQLKCGVSHGEIQPDGQAKYVVIAEKTAPINVNGSDTNLEIHFKTTKGKNVVLSGLSAATSPFADGPIMTTLMANIDIETSEGNVRFVRMAGTEMLDAKSGTGDIMNASLPFSVGSEPGDTFVSSCSVIKFN